MSSGEDKTAIVTSSQDGEDSRRSCTHRILRNRESGNCHCRKLMSVAWGQWIVALVAVTALVMSAWSTAFGAYRIRELESDVRALKDKCGHLHLQRLVDERIGVALSMPHSQVPTQLSLLS